MTILIFIIILGVLILSHEFGHFITAKRSGIKVEEFGFGFPPRIFGKKIGETTYTLNLIPFGGFVKIEGEEGDHPDDPRSFAAKSPYIQALVLGAGVLFNVLLAFILLSIVSWAGTPTQLDDTDTPARARDIRVLIGLVAPDSPAEKAGLLSGDTILRVSKDGDEKEIRDVSTLQEFVKKYGDDFLTLTVLRGAEESGFNVYARSHPPEGEGALGISLVRVGVVSHPWWEAPWEGFKMTLRSIALTARGFVEIIRIAFSGGNAGAYVAGPVGIVSLVDQSLGLGFVFLIQFTALLSINLAIINLIPFPALDGGRLFFLLIETVRRKPLNKKITAWVNAASFFFLLFLMLLITIADVRKLF